MSKSATSVFVFGIYLTFVGLGFLLIPNIILGILGIPPTTEPWIHIIGMLLLLLAYYDIQSARAEQKVFFRLSVYARASVILFFTAFVVIGIAPPVLILFGMVDLLAAIWTAFALRTE